MLHRKPPKAKVVYLPRYILVQSICPKLTPCGENCNGADGPRIFSKKIQRPQTKSRQVLCTDIIWYSCVLSSCSFMVWCSFAFQYCWWGNKVQMIIVVKVYHMKISMVQKQNTSLYKNINLSFCKYVFIFVFTSYLKWCFSLCWWLIKQKHKYNNKNKWERFQSCFHFTCITLLSNWSHSRYRCIQLFHSIKYHPPETWSHCLVCMGGWWHVRVRPCVSVCVPKHVYFCVLQSHPTLENDLLKWNYAVPWPMANGMSCNLSSSWAVNKIWLAIIWLYCWYSIPSSTSFLLSPILSPHTPLRLIMDVLMGEILLI